MTHRPDVVCSRELAARWCALAERRLAYLTELFDSGRWRRYYTDKSLLDDIRHAKAAVQIWRSLASGETPAAVIIRQAPAKVAVTPAAHTTWTPSARTETRSIELPPALHSVLAASEIVVPAEMEVREEVTVEPAITVAAPRIDMAALAQALSIGIGPDSEEDEPVLDLDAIERRYPALAHTL